MTYTDPDFSGIDALPDPDGPTRLSATLEDLVGAIRSGRDGVNGTSAGVAPDKVVEVSGQAETAARDESTNAATRQAAVKILKDAAAAWKRDAPKADAMNTAEKRLADAVTADEQARAALAACTTDEARTFMQPIVNSASSELLAATTALESLKAKRDAANKAFERARKQAAEKLAGAARQGGQDGGTGKPVPGTGTSSTSTGAGSGSGSSSGNNRTASPGAGKPATPSMPTVGQTSAPAATKTSSDNKSTDPSALLSALSQNGQQGQGQQQSTPQAQAQPAASTQPQQQNQQDGKDKGDPSKKTPGVIDVDDIARELGETGTGAAAAVLGTATPAPAVNAASTALRPGVQVPGTGPGGTPTPQPVPATSGNSVEGLNTKSDVGGRSTPTPGAFDSTKTTTSAAHTAETGQGTQQQTARPAGTGMPMGMMPLAPGAAGPSYGSPAKKDENGKIVGYGNNPQTLLLNGGYAVSESVKGGTICQALNQENQALIRV
ncbi:hypothetical protein [Mycobacterium sp. D16Q16]|uniref:hypothetical protein n=1 Tax=Mycobacterium sp. D16Q16 TaxID=1855659 RepID=UPI0009924A7C|nr:hypothetical protein [Mycobacterium sp. D16Q16]